MTQVDFRDLESAVDWVGPGKRTYKISLGEQTTIPLVAIVGPAKGPTVLLTAGAHGDEFEGSAVLFDLARSVDPQHITGRLLLIPTLNPGALGARTRLSPLDGRDLNRSFPGAQDGTICERIAWMVSTACISKADLVFDLHAGGSALGIIPSVMVHPRPQLGDTLGSLRMAQALGVPATILIDEAGSETMLDGEAERQGKVFGCVELGSFGVLSPAVLGMGAQAMRNLLYRTGIMPGLPIPLPPLAVGRAQVADSFGRRSRGGRSGRRILRALLRRRRLP